MMLKHIHKAIPILLILLCFGFVTAGHAASIIQKGNEDKTSGAYLLAKKYSRETCPLVSSLEQDSDKKWKAPGGWYSSDPSFVTEVKHFIGAQWSGVNVGGVVCLYIKGGRGDFPVSIFKSAVALSPTGGAWSQDKGGYKDCHSTDVNECAFERERVVQSDKSIYDELDFYKGRPVHN